VGSPSVSDSQATGYSSLSSLDTSTPSKVKAGSTIPEAGDAASDAKELAQKLKDNPMYLIILGMEDAAIGKIASDQKERDKEANDDDG
jgi:hypothetical protein